MSISKRQLTTPADSMTPVAGNGLLDRRALLGRGIVFAGAAATGVGASRPAPPPNRSRTTRGAATMGDPTPPRQQPSRFEKNVVRMLSNPNHEPRNSHARTPHHLLNGTHHAIGAALHDQSLRHPGHRSGQAPPGDPRHGAAAEDLLARGSRRAIRWSRAWDSSSAAAIPRRCSPRSRCRRPRRRCTASSPTRNGPASCSRPCSTRSASTRRRSGSSPKAPMRCALHRSVPVKKGFDDAMIALYQNGERIMPGNGYPMRLLLPGYQGNMNVKFLRRIKLIDQPAMSFYEAKTYSQVLPGERFWRFHFLQEVKSFITHPSFGHSLKGPGYYEISGVAYSGTGRINRVMVSADGGKSWAEAALQGDPQPQAFTRFRMPWRWDGQPVDAAKPRLGRGRQRAAVARGVRRRARADLAAGQEPDTRSPTSTTTASRAGASTAKGRSSMSTRKLLVALGVALGSRRRRSRLPNRRTSARTSRKPTSRPGTSTSCPTARTCPPGSGTAAQGAPIYAQKCALCHGEDGRNPRPGYAPMVGLQKFGPHGCAQDHHLLRARHDDLRHRPARHALSWRRER